MISALSLIHSLLTQEGLAANKSWFMSTFPGEIMPACHAISLHNLMPEDVKIDFKRYPYAFLLCLCDELQDWGRTTVEKDHSELVDLRVDFQRGIPMIDCTLKINNEEKKHESLNDLKTKLDGGDLIHVCIKQKDSIKEWKM